jgi:hypothetical protein
MGLRYARAGRVVEVTNLMANIFRNPSVTTARPKTLVPLAARFEVAGDGPNERWLDVRLPSGDPHWSAIYQRARLPR